MAVKVNWVEQKVSAREDNKHGYSTDKKLKKKMNNHSSSPMRTPSIIFSRASFMLSTTRM